MLLLSAHDQPCLSLDHVRTATVLLAAHISAVPQAVPLGAALIVLRQTLTAVSARHKACEHDADVVCIPQSCA